MKCPWSDCVCTHTGACMAGWLDNDKGTAVPCPQCRPGLSDMVLSLPREQDDPIDMSVLRDKSRDSRFWNGLDRT